MSSDSNTTVYDKMHSYCVLVNNGSGVLVNAMTLDYTYVLTAAHVIHDDIADNIVKDNQGNELQVLSILKCVASGNNDAERNDYAILIVEYQERVSQQSIMPSDLSVRENIFLVGYPKTERSTLDPIKTYSGKLTSAANELIIVSLDTIPGKTTIEGMSGGGLYYINNSEVFLVGIEFQMDGTRQEQQYGRVQCHSLDKFNELIKAYNKAQMIPAFLECFSRLSDTSFAFNVIDNNNIHNLKVELDKFLSNIIGNGLPPPYELMCQYDTQLLVDPIHANEMSSKELWVAYLEFIVISALLDNTSKVNNSYIRDMDRKRRFLYTSNRENWIKNLENLLKTARSLLDVNGTLIVASPDSAASLLPPEFRLERVIKNIAVIPGDEPIPTIDNVESNIYASFKLTHLEALRRKCVIDSEDEYCDIPSGYEQLTLLRRKLNEIIN